MTKEEFISFVKAKCKHYGIKCQLRNSKRIRYFGDTFSGCFDDVNRVLICSMKRDDSLEILAHEYCHLTQWVEQAPIWMKANELGSYDRFNKFLEGGSIDHELHLGVIRDLELDNEKRTVALIKKMKLPIDIKKYIKRANSYVMMYNWMMISGRWCSPNNLPYQNQAILDAMPSTFSLNYEKLPKRLENLYREANI